MKIKNIEEGKVVTGTVYEVKDKEVIVDIGYATEGTIHLERLTRLDAQTCHDVVKKGDEIQAVVRKKDDEQGIVLLSRVELEQKELFEDLQNKFEQDEIIEAVVKDVVKGGLKVRAQGFDMFMPRSEVSIKYVEDLRSYLHEKLPVKIIEIGRKNNRIRIVVSHKAVEKSKKDLKRQEELKDINVGDVLEGTVTKLVPYGAFIRFDNVEGLLHISEMSHHRIKQPSEIVKEGDKIEVKVIGAEGDKRSLSLKALQKSPWETFAEEHKVGEKVTGKIVKKMQFGILVEVERDVAGVVHRNDYSWNPRFNLAGNVEVGDEIEVQILSIDVENQKMQLSKKHLEYNPWEDVKVKVGEEVSGEVKELQNRGALVEIQGVYGFLPISEISDAHVENVSDALEEGQVINAVVLKFNRENWQMVISKKAYEKKRIQDEYKKHLKSSNKDEHSQTLGELFADKFKDMKK